MGIWNNSRYYSVAGGLPNCTTYVWVRCEEEGLPSPANGNAEDWPNRLNKGWQVVYTGSGGSAPIKYGDVVVSKAQHHVCFVNSDGTVSGSGYMSRLYLDEDCEVPSPGMTYRGDQSFWSNVRNNDWQWNGWNLTRPTYRPNSSGSYRSTSYYFYHRNSLSYEWGGSGTVYVLRYMNGSPSGGGGGDTGPDSGGGGGDDSGQEDGGTPSGWYPESGTISETECGKQPEGAGDVYNTGSQDNPILPSVYTNGADKKEDGWWSPLTTRTYERIYLFNPDGSGRWSDWVETKSYTRSYGEQDEAVAPWAGQKNEGWVMNWE